MPLAMSRPWKHPDDGVYWFRRVCPRTPRACWQAGREKSLKTQDAALAKPRHAQLLSEVEARSANLRQGPRSLSEAAAHAIAAAWQDRWIHLHRANPAGQTCPTSLGEAMWTDDLGNANPFRRRSMSGRGSSATDFIGHDDASRISSDDTGDLEPVSCRYQ